MKAVIAAALCLTLIPPAPGAPALAAAPPTPLEVVSQGPALQARAEQFVVRSRHTGRSYVIEVTAPFTPPVLPGQKTSAVYALDGGYGIAGPSLWLLGGAGLMQPAYVVTVGYAPGSGGGRESDLLFRPGTRPNGTIAKGGGGLAFTRFLLDELRPFIEARYPVNPKQSVLFGHSLSGIYAANVLADRPDAFSGYLIASPSLWADPGVVERLASTRTRAHNPRVYLAYGADEDAYMVEGAEKIAGALGAAGSRLQLRKQAFEGQTHVTYYPALMSTAFPFLLPRAAPVRHPDPVSLPLAQLRRYPGAYRLSDGRTVEVKLDGERLQAELGGLPPQSLLAEAPNRFFIHGVDARFAFQGPEPGPAQALVITVNGAETRAPRVRD